MESNSELEVNIINKRIFRNVIVLYLVLFVLSAPLGHAEEIKEYKLGEDTNISIYLDESSLTTNLDDLPDTIPRLFTANCWIIVKPKGYTEYEIRRYQKWRMNASTGVSETKVVIEGSYKNGKLVDTKDAEEWHEVPKDTNGGRMIQDIFRYSLLRWDLNRYMLTGKSILKAALKSE